MISIYHNLAGVIAHVQNALRDLLLARIAATRRKSLVFLEASLDGRKYWCPYKIDLYRKGGHCKMILTRLFKERFHFLGGYSNYFLTGWAARGLEPLPISKDFSPSKNGWFYSFFKIFANRDPFLRVFLPTKWLILPFFCNFCEMGPSSKNFFLNKVGPMSKDFC